MKNYKLLIEKKLNFEEFLNESYEISKNQSGSDQINEIVNILNDIDERLTNLEENNNEQYTLGDDGVY